MTAIHENHELGYVVNLRRQFLNSDITELQELYANTSPGDLSIKVWESLQNWVEIDRDENQSFSIRETAKERDPEKEDRIKSQVIQLASVMHDIWRKPRLIVETGKYDPKMKPTTDTAWLEQHGITGDNTFDLANTDVIDLPRDWYGKNTASAEITIRMIDYAKELGIPLDDGFLELGSSILHDDWLERNRDDASDLEKRNYFAMDEPTKEQDRVIVRKGIELFGRE